MSSGEKTKELWQNLEYKKLMSEAHKCKTFPHTRIKYYK